ncbi:MAG: hypothetical protein VX408_00145 [Pseudomonadota bacterium]|nr:hypothetical protein [Pseudomonadota bacterium]MED6317163.1 hypothetical protein [Pseudomonadota bacterium]|tara:strand:+ start:249 stop:497 length:249 start_codon:yes stop_codon:yes gene_type:complete
MYISTQQLAIMLSRPTCSFDTETKELTVPWWGAEYQGHNLVITTDAAQLNDAEGTKVDDVEFDYSNESIINEMEQLASEQAS